MDWLAQNGFQVLALKDYLRNLGANLPNQVCLSFDDGYKCIFDELLPIARDRQLPFVCSVPTDFIGGQNDWDRHLGFASLQIMSEEELKLLAADPLVTICSHGLSHRSLGRLSAEAIRKELIASRQKLKELTELNVEGFCFPFGQRADIPANAGQLLQKAGYSYGLSTIWGRKTHPNQVFEIRRIEICPADDLRTFANKLLGFQAKWQFRQLARDGKSKLSGLFQHRAIG